MKESLIEFNGQQVHYYEWGRNDNPTIVCLHGLVNTGLSFLTLAECMESNYHIVAFDQPGHGDTPPFLNENQYLFSNISVWYDAIFRDLITSPFTILGHSWGADIALYCSLISRELINGIILLDGGFTFPVYEVEMTLTKAHNLWTQYLDDAVYPTFQELKREYQTYTRSWNEQIEQMVLSMFKSRGPYVLIASKFTIMSIINAFFHEPFSRTFSQISVPLLLLHATVPTQSLAREKGISHLTKNVRDASVVPIQNAGHLLHWDDPQAVYVEIDQWLSKSLYGCQ